MIEKLMKVVDYMKYVEIKFKEKWDLQKSGQTGAIIEWNFKVGWQFGHVGYCYKLDKLVDYV